MNDVLILERAVTPRFVGRPIQRSKSGMGKSRSLSDLEATAINPTVISALREASRLLKSHGVRHVAIGALAVGVHGWPRATGDVDLLLGPEAWVKAPDGSQTPAVPLPDTIGGVDIDYLPLDVAFAGVVLTKLLRLAMRDQADIVELVKAGGVDETRVRSYLDLNAPMLTSRFEALVAQAKRELDDA